jgi:cytochrome c-type biogenesis protein CcmH
LIRRWAPWVVLAIVVIAVVAVAAWPSGTSSPAHRANALASELRCPDCESLSVADSNTPSAIAVRADIKARIKAGESDSHIRGVYVGLYGQSILLKPASSGVSAIVWVLPVLVLVVGGCLLVLALRRWRAEPRLHATDADREIVEREREETP